MGGKNVSLELNNSHQEGFTLGIYDQRNVEKLQTARRAIDSTLKADSIDPIKEIGRFSLLTTKQNTVVEVEDSSALGVNYTVPYDYIKPFFEIENRGRFTKSGSFKAINTSAKFSLSDDSLSSLTVEISKSVNNPERRFMSIEDINLKLMSSLGNPAITVKNKTFDGHREVSVWPSTPFSVIVREGSAKIFVTFVRTKNIGAFHFFGWLTTPSSFVVWPHIFSWTQNNNT